VVALGALGHSGKLSRHRSQQEQEAEEDPWMQEPIVVTSVGAHKLKGVQVGRGEGGLRADLEEVGHACGLQVFLLCERYAYLIPT
jgi:hypothetical protein